MQLTLGRRWIVTLEFSVRLARFQESCSRSTATLVAMRRRQHADDLKWEQDQIAGQMLSGWDEWSLKSGIPDLSGPIGSRERRGDLLKRW